MSPCVFLKSTSESQSNNYCPLPYKGKLWTALGGEKEKRTDIILVGDYVTGTKWSLSLMVHAMFHLH